MKMHTLFLIAKLNCSFNVGFFVLFCEIQFHPRKVKYQKTEKQKKKKIGQKQKNEKQ